MRKTQLVQTFERFLDIGIYPGFPAICGFLGTDRDHIGESDIGRDSKTVGPDGFAEGARHPKVIEWNNRPGFRFNPESLRIITSVRHREYARCIGFQQQVEINGHEH